MISFVFTIFCCCCSLLLADEFPSWMVNQVCNDCAQITTADLDPLNMNRLMAECQRRGNLGFIRYRIYNQLLHFDTTWPHNHPRVEMMNQSMQYLLTSFSLPDIDFVVCLEDAMDGADLPAPFFVFAKNRTLQEKLLLIPDFEVLTQSDRFVSQVTTGMTKFPWKKREEKAFWRGGSTGGIFNRNTFLYFPRSHLVTKSLKHPDLLDARFVLPLVQSDEPQVILSSFARYFVEGSTPITEHMRYKYQILADGNSCAYSRAYWQLFSDCPIFKHDSPNIQWYYGALIPWVHYVPCKADFSDLIIKLEWAKKHDQIIHTIGKNGRDFARANLQRAEVYRYLYLVLSEYAKIQNDRSP